jgi:hypothetical protein
MKFGPAKPGCRGLVLVSILAAGCQDASSTAAVTDAAPKAPATDATPTNKVADASVEAGPVAQDASIGAACVTDGGVTTVAVLLTGDPEPRG